MKNYNKLFWIGLSIGFVFIAGGIIAYTCRFAKNGPSEDPAVWGQFGDYINFLVSIASLIVVSMLTYSIHNIEQKRADEQREESTKRDKEQKDFASSLEKPILIFRDIGSKWEVANVGRGAALNIIIAHAETEDHWDESVKCYSLESGSKFTIFWRIEASMWIAYYNDVFGNYYLSTCKNDETLIKQNNDESLFPLVNRTHKRLGDMTDVINNSNGR